ncbi:MAG: cyclic nucleotide-binding domain-containing protein, partial [Candidatus Promineifilaceae bacterium]|nr:cyclic nucleotide-binding domain-containing protein [Candidatus Promineifilaceae bacterium]
PLLKEERFAGGETIFEKNEDGHSLYIIVEGQVRIHDGERDLDALHGGDAFGEMSILDPAPRSASATAVEESVLLRLDQQTFRELLTDHSDVAWRVMQLLTRRLRNVMDRDAGRVAPVAEG